MSRFYEDVKVERKAHDTQHLTHPCFGVVSVSEVSGRSVMFGSELIHDRVLRVRVKGAYQLRNLSNDWIHEKETFLEFDMTHSQFAQFITSNSNRATPITLRMARTGPLEQVKEIDCHQMPAKIEQFRSEMREAVLRVQERSCGAFEKLEEALNEAKITGKLREQLKGLATQAKGGLDHLPSTLGFILEQAHEAAEGVANDAKVGLEAYALQRLRELEAAEANALSAAPPNINTVSAGGGSHLTNPNE